MGDPGFEKIKREGDLAIAQAETKRLEASFAKLTDKGAKDFSKGMGSIEKTSKMGGFAAMSIMLNKIIEATPAVELITGYLEKWINLFTKQIDWKGFTKILEDLDDQVVAVSKSLEHFIKLIKGIFEWDWDKVVKNYWWIMYYFLEINKSMDEMQGKSANLITALDTSTISIKGLGTETGMTTLKFEDLEGILKKIKDAIDNIDFGGGGGGGDGGIDLDPWNLFPD